MQVEEGRVGEGDSKVIKHPCQVLSYLQPKTILGPSGISPCLPFNPETTLVVAQSPDILEVPVKPRLRPLFLPQDIERRVRDWLRSSGSLPHIQARLKTDLYAAIQVRRSCIDSSILSCP